MNEQGHEVVAIVDWWFAYTQISVDLVAKSGFPVARI